MKGKIMSDKTPNEIVKGLEVCTKIEVGCDDCPYEGVDNCGYHIKKDAHDALVDLLKDRQYEIKTTVEEKSESKDTEVKFKSSFDLETMKKNTKSYMEHLGNEGRKQMNENHIATLAVIANTDALRGNDDVRAFIGGVSISFAGTDNEQMKILFQLCRTIYQRLISETSKRVVDEIFDQFFTQLKEDRDDFNFNSGEALKNSFLKALEMMRKMHEAECNDSDEDED